MHASDWLTVQIRTVLLAVSYVLCFTMTYVTLRLIFLSLVCATDATFISHFLNLVFTAPVGVSCSKLAITRFFRRPTGLITTV